MKRLTTSILCLSLGATAAFSAPKPLLNPFADTVSQQTSTQPQSAPMARATQTSTQQQATTQSMVPAPNYDPQPLPTAQAVKAYSEPVLSPSTTTRLVVKGQGVAPSFTQSPAQAFALAKRAAMVDAYRLLGEKIQGVRVEGQDLIKNMMVKRSQVRTEVNAMIKEASVVETDYKDGLCEVEVELIISGAKWHATLAHSFAE